MFRNRNPKAVFFTEQNMECFYFFLCLVIVAVSAIPQALTDDHFSLAAVFFSFSELSGGP